MKKLTRGKYVKISISLQEEVYKKVVKEVRETGGFVSTFINAVLKNYFKNKEVNKNARV